MFRSRLLATTLVKASVDKYKGVPPYGETQNYVKKIVSNYGKTYHPILPPTTRNSRFISLTIGTQR